jgi:hypothetical protein
MLRAVFVAVASSLVLLLASCRSVPDSVMLVAFDQHEEILDQLVQMARADNLSCPIPAAGHADCVSPARLGEYQRLLRSAKVFGISPQKNTGCILFPSVCQYRLKNGPLYRSKNGPPTEEWIYSFSRLMENKNGR